MRLTFSKLFLMLALISFTACDENKTSSDNVASQPNPSPVKIALVMKTLTNPFFVAMESGARKAEKEFGIVLVVRTAAQETSTTQQINIIEKLIRENEVKAIVIAPADSIKLIPSLKKAQDKGIHVINIDNQLNPDFTKKAGAKPFPFLSVDLLTVSYDFRLIALVVILLRAGLELSKKALARVGAQAILLSFIPGLCEGGAIALLGPHFLPLTHMESAILGFIIAAVSPAVVVPMMISFIKRKMGRRKVSRQ